MLRRSGVLVSLFVVLAPSVGAAAVTLDGGSVSARAHAGLGPDGYPQHWDTPASLVPQFGTTALRAEASGTVWVDGYGNVPVSAWTTISSTIDANDSGSMSVDLTHDSNASLAWFGAGSYCCAGAESSVSVLFSVDTTTMASLAWLWDTGEPNATRGVLYSADNNQLLFDSQREQMPNDPMHSPYALFEYMLQPGQYSVVIEGRDTAGWYGSTGRSWGTLSLDLVTPVPLPASVWLLSAGIAGIGALRKRRSSPQN